jgi:hypothetical protein
VVIMPDVLGFEVQGSKQGRPQGAQFTVAPPQHFLYFFPEPHGHGSFRPTLGASRQVENHLAQAKPSAPRPASTSLTLQSLIWIAAIWWLSEHEA